MRHTTKRIPQLARLFVLGCIFGLSCAACRQTTPELFAKPQPARGQSRTLDSGDPNGATGWWPQVVFDNRGHAHIAYCDAHLGVVRYGYQAPGQDWHIETVPTQGHAGKYLSLAVDQNGKVALSFYNQSTQYFDYATRTEPRNPWQIEHIAWGPESGMASALQFDAQGTAHVLYHLNAGQLIHASRHPTQANWLKRTVGAYASMYSARIGSCSTANAPLFSYADWQGAQGRLFVGHPTPGGWDEEAIGVSAKSGWRSDVISVQNDLWLFYTADLTKRIDLALRTADGIWHHVKNIAQGQSFALTRFGAQPVLVFQDRKEAKQPGLFVTHPSANGNNTWPRWQIDAAPNAGEYLAAAVSPTGTLVVLYYSPTQQDLKIYEEQLAP